MTAAQHHAEAYRLDCAAGPYLEIEHHYQEAIRLDPTDVRYRTDWICFLLTRARVLAADKAWDEAAALGSHEYLVLHWPVARMAIETARIYLAWQVMEAVPLDLRVQNPCWATLWHLVRLLEQCEDDRLVFPDDIEIEDQWKGPHLLPGEHKGETLSRWYAGKITGMDSEITIRFGVPPGPGQEPRFGWLGCTHEEFQKWCGRPWEPPVQVDDFIEVGYYGKVDYDNSVILVARHAPLTEGIFSRLPPVVPDHLRYLRAAGWIRA